ncbi:MAG: AAA family ATPase [Pseudomonadota bacterium]
MGKAEPTDPAPPPPGELLLAERTRSDIAILFERSAFEGGFLLVGPEGQGKARLAQTLAGDILSGASELGGGSQNVRQQIAAGAHPDYCVLTRTENDKTGKLRSEIDVDAARSVISRLQQTSVSGKRVVIVDLADDLGRSAANSLLKVLEEPPRGTCFFLLSRSPSRLLPTLVSRCRRLVLRPVPDDTIAEWLVASSSVGREDAQRLAAASGGAPGRAWALASDDRQGPLGIAEALLEAADNGGDLLAAARPFGAKDQERAAEEAAEIVLTNLRQRAVGGTGQAQGFALAAYDEARLIFVSAGTADRTQTALMAGLAIRRCLAGKNPPPKVA